jgi:hypothetical protein
VWRYRGVLALDNALEIGVSPRYAGQPSAAAYMELTCHPRTGRGPDTHILKANHPDDAANWLADFRVCPLFCAEIRPQDVSCVTCHS